MMRPESIWDNSAHKLAQYIWDDDGEKNNYRDYVSVGNDPREHILYHAGVILGFEKDFKKDIEEYLDSIDGEDFVEQ